MFRINARVGVHDPALDVPAAFKSNGMMIRPASKGIRYVEPGEYVELDEKEGKRLLGLHGAYDDNPRPTSAYSRITK